MKNNTQVNISKIVLGAGLCILAFTSCKKEDAANEITINFKEGSGYTATDMTAAKGTALKVGIEAGTEKKKDPLKKFNISESVNGGANATLLSKDIDGQDFSYDHSFTLEDTVHGNKHKYTYTVTNKDGINAQKFLTITVQ
jgi:hypothetical protein